jgi:hypothetical protein
MTEPLTEDIMRRYVQKAKEDKAIQIRFSHIVLKIDAMYKDIFKIKDVNFTYACDFLEDDKVCFSAGIKNTGVVIPFPTLPLSCYWNDADLHINLEMLKSDLIDVYNKAKNAKKEEDTKQQPKNSVWEFVKSLFRF